MEAAPPPAPAPRHRLLKALGLFGLAGVVVWGVSGFAKPSAKPAPQPDPEPAPPKDKPLEKLAGYQLLEWVTEGAKLTDDLQTVVVLHELNSSPELVRKIMADWPGKARFIAPTGRYVGEGGFNFVDPQAQTGLAALRDEGESLLKLMSALRAFRSPQRRLIVAGLGNSTVLALSTSLYGSFAVREGLGVGGYFEPELVPLLGGDSAIRLLAQATSPQLDKTTAAFKLASERGFTAQLDTGDFDVPLSPSLIQEYLYPLLTKLVTA